MITIPDIKYAMVLLKEGTISNMSRINQLIQTLQVYLERDEYHHDDLIEACSCVRLAGYEIKK